MDIEPQRLGTDLWLLNPLDRADDRTSRGDLRTILRQGVDLGTVASVDNLKQALLLRFLTPRGSLTELGHPEYGSRLFELFGEPITATNMNRAKLYALEALGHEPRIDEVLSINVTTNRRASPTRIDISFTAHVAESGEILNMVFPFYLS